MNVSRSALLNYSADKMYAVITDVRAYPSFLNWCSDVELISESSDEMVAKLFIAYSKLNISFTTRNVLRENESLTMSLVDGPFSKLNGQWDIQDLGISACKVSLEMDFDFDNVITQKLFGRVFQSVISAQLDSFQKRAHALYSL